MIANAGSAPGEELGGSRRAGRRTPQRLAVVLGLGVLAATIVLSEWTVCPLARLTHHPCPGCGMTRAALSLLSLDWAAALRWHPLSPVCVPLVLLLAAEGLVSYVAERDVRWSGWLMRGALAGWLWAALGLLVLGTWLARFFGFFGGPVPV